MLYIVNCVRVEHGQTDDEIVSGLTLPPFGTEQQEALAEGPLGALVRKTAQWWGQSVEAAAAGGPGVEGDGIVSQNGAAGRVVGTCRWVAGRA